MKKILCSLFVVFLLGCSKDNSTSSTTSTTQQTSNISGVQLPAADAGLYTVISDADGTSNLQNSAWFETPNSSKDVGKVNYKISTTSNNLTYFFGKYASTDFLPDSIDITNWTVEGKNGFPGFNVTDDQKMPIISNLTSSVSQVTTSTTDFSISHSYISNADYVIYGLVNLSNQLSNKYFVASKNSSTSYTFKNSDFTPFIQTNNGVKGIPYTVTSLKYKTVSIQGKTIVLVKQYTSWGAVEVK